MGVLGHLDVDDMSVLQVVRALMPIRKKQFRAQTKNNAIAYSEDRLRWVPPRFNLSHNLIQVRGGGDRKLGDSLAPV